MFSITTGCFQAALNRSAMVRATMSVVPPAGKGTIIRTARSGKLWARASGMAPTASNSAARIVMDRNGIPVPRAIGRTQSVLTAAQTSSFVKLLGGDGDTFITSHDARSLQHGRRLRIPSSMAFPVRWPAAVSVPATVPRGARAVHLQGHQPRQVVISQLCRL